MKDWRQLLFGLIILAILLGWVQSIVAMNQQVKNTISVVIAIMSVAIVFRLLFGMTGGSLGF